MMVAAGIAGTILGRRIVAILPGAAYWSAIKALLLAFSLLLIAKGLTAW